MTLLKWVTAKMRLLKELINESRVIVEDKDGKKNYFIEGIFLQGGIKNRNGRIYPEGLLDEKVNDYIQSAVATNRAWGELGHPDTPNINLDRVSHRIVDLRKEGKNWVGKARIADTPMGNIARGLMDTGGSLGVSSRGVGSLSEEDGASVVQPDFVICTAGDIVADPSAPDAYVESVMEGKEWVIVDGKFTVAAAEAARARIKKTPSRRLQEQALKEFQHFLTQIQL